MKNSLFDNARISMMILGVFLHGALLFRPDVEFFVQFSQKDYFFTHLAFWIHLFRMPLFFLISGFLCAPLLSRFTAKEFIERRSTRLLIPFFVSLVTINAFSIWFIQGQPLIEEENASLVMHLWFLPALFVFTLLHASIHSTKIFNFLPLVNIKIPINLHIKFLFFTFILSSILFLIEHASWRLPLEKIRIFTDGLLDAPLIFSYLGYYFFGVSFFYFKDHLSKILKCWPAAALITLTFVMIHSLEKLPNDSYVFEIIKHASTLSISLLILSFFYYLIPDSWAKPWFSAFSYTLYLFHLPIILILRLPIMNTFESISAQYIFITFVTIIICIAIHFVITKNAILSLLFNGK